MLSPPVPPQADSIVLSMFARTGRRAAQQQNLPRRLESTSVRIFGKGSINKPCVALCTLSVSRFSLVVLFAAFPSSLQLVVFFCSFFLVLSHAVLEKMFQKKLTILHKCTREGCFSSVSVTWNLAACGEDVSRTSSSRAHTMQDLCAIGSAGEIA